jgi:LDH2 family malate/lactate/ureidoglycolate dehydrogenase
MLMPLGGEAQTSGYKGYGLAAAVEMLTGVLGGGAVGLSVAALWDTTRRVTTSQFHLVIDPAAVGDVADFYLRLRGYVAELKALPRRAGIDEILVAGELEWRADERQAERVALLPSVIVELASMAVERGLFRTWRPVVGTRS